MIPVPTQDLPAPRLPEPIRTRCRRTVAEAVARTSADAVLLSGGLDSSIVAACAVEQGRDLLAVTVGRPDAPDVAWARRVAEHLGLEHHVVPVTLGDLLGHTEATARILSSFDPMTLRNCAVQHAAMEHAARLGAGGVLTGDGGDELFVGYSFMVEQPPGKLEGTRRRMAEEMRFDGFALGAAHGLDVEAPLTREEVVRFALDLDRDALVQPHGDELSGKWALREAFHGILPREALYRAKAPAEAGSGSRNLTDHLDRELGGELPEARQRVLHEEEVEVRDAEHLAYYRQYRRHHPPPRDREAEHGRCPECKGPKRTPDTTFCTVCGAYPL